MTTSTPAANSSCALPGGLLATAVTRPQIAGHGGERNDNVGERVDHRDARWVCTPPNATGAPCGTCQTWSPRRGCPKACVEEEQWPPSESPKLAGARAIRTPAARSSRLPDRRLPPRVSQVHRCVPSRAEAGVDAALIHHYFDSKQQLFLATVALPLELPEHRREGRCWGQGRSRRATRPNRSRGLGLRAPAVSRGGNPHHADGPRLDALGR